MNNESRLSNINRDIAISLLVRLRIEGLIDNHSLIGNDEEDGLSIRWPESRMFCDVTDGEIVISIIPLHVQSFYDIEKYSFKSDELNAICTLINKKLIK